MPSTSPMTNLEYIQGKLGVVITEQAAKVIFFDRDLDADAPVGDSTQKQKDLCLADAYMWCSTLPTTTGSVEDSDGNWSHKEGSSSLGAKDRAWMRAEALRIYKLYGEYKGRPTIKFNSSGMRLCRR